MSILQEFIEELMDIGLQEFIKELMDIGTDHEKLYESWKSTGMLDELDEETARKVADGFTKMARYLFVTESAYLGSVPVCAFPVVRAVFSRYGGPNDKYSPMAVCEQLNQTIKELADKDVSSLGIDYEAEAALEVAKYFSNNGYSIINE